MIVFSVLDRLLKNLPAQEADDGSSYRQSRDWLERQMESAVPAFRKTVQQNLEWLLNTRRIPPPPNVSLAWVKQYPVSRGANGNKGRKTIQEELHQPVETSVYSYGLPSFAHVTLSPGAQESDVNRLAEEIEGTIRVFEPRILDPKVTVEKMPSLHREIRFRITGKLRIKPDPKFVQYRTLLDVDTGRYQVEVSGDTAGG